MHRVLLFLFFSSLFLLLNLFQANTYLLSQNFSIFELFFLGKHEQLYMKQYRIIKCQFIVYQRQSRSLQLYNLMTQSNLGKTFKIRKTLKVQRTHDAQQQEQVANLKDLRLQDVDNLEQKKAKEYIWADQSSAFAAKLYENDQQDINCCRFPHSSFCGCESNCLLQNFDSFQICPGLYYGAFASGLKTRSLLQSGITHILNISSKQYTKRTKYFQYLTIDLHNNTEEDVKKYFRLTNRFIKQAVLKKGKVFIHSNDLQLAAIVSMGYLIGITRTPMKPSLQLALKGKTQIAPHFMKQIESYDLQKMAFVSLQRE